MFIAICCLSFVICILDGTKNVCAWLRDADATAVCRQTDRQNRWTDGQPDSQSAQPASQSVRVVITRAPLILFSSNRSYSLEIRYTFDAHGDTCNYFENYRTLFNSKWAATYLASKNCVLICFIDWITLITVWLHYIWIIIMCPHRRW